MGSEAEPQPSSIPKLSLFSLPSKPPEPPGILTPPLQALASVPFQWEEVPGKPRDCSTAKPKAARCLDLPPRLLTEAGKITNTPSPTTVLDGPYSSRSLSHTMSFSLGKASFVKERVNFSSWRWGSFKDNGGDTGVISTSHLPLVVVLSVMSVTFQRRSSSQGLRRERASSVPPSLISGQVYTKALNRRFRGGGSKKN
ncbi:uncharacterized protein At4g00950-like [Actinidia eriantha]|uniref:uncharacterized protein At4g00950-like n=1 Tax=Actinidia eriantha TaxID=165200 RepID=UPI002582E45D|nr:uncharacterized protein At4g00950-like [Actinidia eriantha]